MWSEHSCRGWECLQSGQSRQYKWVEQEGEESECHFLNTWVGQESECHCLNMWVGQEGEESECHCLNMWVGQEGEESVCHFLNMWAGQEGEEFGYSLQCKWLCCSQRQLKKPTKKRLGMVVSRESGKLSHWSEECLLPRCHAPLTPTPSCMRTAPGFQPHPYSN